MSRKTALKLIGVVIVACYLVPYAVLGSVASWQGAFLFWCLAGLAVIVLNAVATAGFKGAGK
ncbi:hypothetical protein [uncultured Paracoccus sp.]|uniref:hypothetical protein n=1 Tax=uncultured Paracoccus sp. TaxID=189685 RepID=UPI00260D17A8|nr:hypothetical protein [uncultured Paracoccus sp.]